MTVTMGSYGIGVSRAVAGIAETTVDEMGLCLPLPVAPFDVHPVIPGHNDDVTGAAERLAAELDAAGLDVLLDDRSVGAGVKFNDTELIGVPTIIVVGKRLAEGLNYHRLKPVGWIDTESVCLG